jgi:hypothetical protein
LHIRGNLCLCHRCGFDLVWQLCEQIEIIADKNEPFKVTQVKEKIGGLRFNFENARSRAESSGQSVSFAIEYIESMCGPGTDGRAVWQRTNLILVLQTAVPERLAPWIKGEEAGDAVFGTMATIPMTWLQNGEQPMPFDVEDFFGRLAEKGGWCSP